MDIALNSYLPKRSMLSLHTKTLLVRVLQPKIEGLPSKYSSDVPNTLFLVDLPLQ